MSSAPEPFRRSLISRINPAWAVPALVMLVAPGTTAESPPVDGDEPTPGWALDLEFLEWDVPWPETGPRDAYPAPDGSVYFAGQFGDYVGQLDPESGEILRFELPEESEPHGVVVDPDGFVWYAAHGTGHLGRLDPNSGEVLRYDLPDAVSDPHSLAWDDSGQLWFTAPQSGDAGFVGRFSPATGEVKIRGVEGGAAEPYGVALDHEGRPWVTFMGSNHLGTLDPESMELELIELPDEDMRARRIDLTSDGAVWFTDASSGRLARYDPASGTHDEWMTPGGEGAGLHALAVDSQDRIWYVEAGLEPNRFVGFDPAGEEFLSVNELQSGGGAVRHMVFDTSAGALWFATDAHTVGRATLP